MSFFRAMKRIFQGKPVFDVNDEVDGRAPLPPQVPQTPATPQPTQPQGPHSTIQKGNERTFPVVYVKRVNTRLNGANMQVYARIYNSWHGEVEVDKIRILNTTREIDTYLRPNEEKEVMVYSGPRMPREQYREAILDYRTRDGGDYFQATHDVGFHMQADKTFSVDEIRLHPPIRDIYG